MPMSIKNTKKKIVLSTSDEDIFKLWSDLGTLSKVSYELYRRGDKNPITGDRISPQVVRIYITRHILQNPDSARLEYQKHSYDQISDDEWHRFLIRRANYHFVGAVGSYTRWIKDNPWVKNYKHLLPLHVQDALDD